MHAGGVPSALAELVDEAPLGLAVTRPDWTLLYGNRTLASWTGIPVEELPGHSLRDLFRVGSRIYIETHVTPLLDMQQAVREVTMELTTRDGRTMPVLVNADCATGPEGRIVRFALVDMRDRRRYELELKRSRDQAVASQARHALMAEAGRELPRAPDAHAAATAAASVAARHLADAVALYGPEGKVLEVAGGLAGVEDLVAALGPLADSGGDGSPRRLGFTQPHGLAPWGALHRFEGGAMGFLWDGLGEPGDAAVRTEYTAFVALAMSKAQALVQAREAVAAREELMALLAHELANPLTALRLEVGARRRRPRDMAATEVAEFARAMDRQLGRMATMLEDMLDVARIRSGHLSLAISRIELAHLTRDIVERMRPGLLEAGMPVAVEAPAECHALGDAGRVEQILVNLLSNAMKYASPGPVEVRVRMAGPSVRLEVADHGPGIAPAARRAIFERFERLPQDTKVQGTGLGLYIVRRLALAQQGEVAVEETAGGGATFVLTLPAS